MAARINWSQRIVGIIAYLLSFFILFLALLWFSRYRGGFSWSSNNDGDPDLLFNLHPIMMILGFLLFPVQAILVYRMMPMEHSNAKVYHFVSHIFSMLCIALGLSAAILYHSRSAIPHFRSLHSWLGIGTVGLWTTQFLFGFVTYCAPKCGITSRRALLPYHQYIGMAVLIMASITASVGTMEKILFVQQKELIGDRLTSEIYIANWMGLSIVLLCLSVVYVVLAQVNKRAREHGTLDEITQLHNSDPNEDSKFYNQD